MRSCTSSLWCLISVNFSQNLLSLLFVVVFFSHTTSRIPKATVQRRLQENNRNSGALWTFKQQSVYKVRVRYVKVTITNFGISCFNNKQASDVARNGKGGSGGGKVQTDTDRDCLAKHRYVIRVSIGRDLWYVGEIVQCKQSSRWNDMMVKYGLWQLNVFSSHF